MNIFCTSCCSLITQIFLYFFFLKNFEVHVLDLEKKVYIASVFFLIA